MELFYIYQFCVRIMHLRQIGSSCGCFEVKYAMLGIKMKWKLSLNQLEHLEDFFYYVELLGEHNSH